MTPRATIDIETRSPVDLKEAGAYIYARHPDTWILCMAYHVPGMSHVGLWNAAWPALGIEDSGPPDILIEWILSGGAVEAHNAQFERCLLAKKAPDWWIDPVVWYCSAAKAAAAGLPRHLDQVSNVIGDQPKDAEGYKLMRKVSNSRLKRLPTADDLQRLYDYCRQDVRAEMSVSEAVPDLSPAEQRLFDLDVVINDRGVCFDVELARIADDLATLQMERVRQEFEALTGIERPTMVKQLVEWICHHGVFTDTLAKDHLTFLLTTDLPDNVRRAIQYRLAANKMSVKKYKRMLAMADPDDRRARGQILYHGATTGRWSGRGVQPQNLPRGKIKDMDSAASEVLDLGADGGTLDYLDMMYGDALDHLSGMLRGVIVAAPGQELVVSDFSAIEARATLWLADDDAALDVFRTGKDIYLDMAGVIFGYPCGKEHKDERQMGKIAILGLGYGMGFAKLLHTCRTMYGVTISPEQSTKILRSRRGEFMDYTKEAMWPTDPQKKALAGMRHKVLQDANIDAKEAIHELAACAYITSRYRSRYEAVPALWREYGDTAKAVVEDGQPRAAGRVQWSMDGDHLCSLLPSGRVRVYRDAEVRMTTTAWGERAVGLTYMREYQGKWIRTGTYGGKLTENVAQSVSRDVMAEAMVRVDERYPIILTIHDEVISEAPAGQTDTGEYQRLMTRIPDWANGFPVDADVSVYQRYRKE